MDQLAQGNTEKILKASGNPELAFRQWETLAPAVSGDAADAPGLMPFLHLLGNSCFLVDFFRKHEDRLLPLLRSPYLQKEKPASVMREEIRSGVKKNSDAAAIKKILRLYKYVEMARICLRDLAGLASFEETGRELSSLAAACVEAALRFLLPPGFSFVVFGMGKLGGEDLNLSSDIDLIYAYQHNETIADLYENLTRTSEGLTRILQEKTEDGFVFRVDLDLRPEGKSGTLLNSSEALVTYYEVKGAPWERGALLKARPIAGDQALGEHILQDLDPFIFRRSIDMSAISEIKAMKEKINREMIKSRGAGYHVKLGVGGIREIEFFVSAFQLIYGGKNPAVRERNTLRALSVLEQHGLVPAEDARRLRETYIFLRRIENRLQMLEEQQTHTLPTEAAALLVLSRQMGAESVDRFTEELKTRTGWVASCFEGLVP